MGDLYWGDNLDVLRRHVADESVDLIYLDPPFNSNRNYNILYREDDRHESEAQIQAFTDTWHWTSRAEETYHELVGGNAVPQKVSDLIAAMRSFIGSNDVMAYLVMMTARLLELHRVLKPTGSIYLHCDPTASHYLKVVMDTIWGPQNFKSEVVWKRTFTHGNVGNNYGAVSDSLLYYSKSNDFRWNQLYTPYPAVYIAKRFNNFDPNGRRWQSVTLRNPGVRPNLRYDYTASNGVTYKPHPNGWSCAPERMQRYDDEGRLHFPARLGGQLRLKLYLDESLGIRLQNIWDDIPPINSQAAERLGYPTQKPEALLERIIRASSNPGDVVLDPFCGCGTAIAVAERLERNWVGIDVTHLAIALIVSRMQAAFPDVVIARHGEPADLAGARELAELDRYDFQNWALSLVAARTVNDGKKGADRGVDGVISFLGGGDKPHRCIVQVKSGHVNAGLIRDLVGTVESQKAEAGLFITLAEPSAPMRTEAIKQGYFCSEVMGRDYPKVQILTIDELLRGKEPELPPLYSPYRLALRRQRHIEQPSLFERAV